MKCHAVAACAALMLWSTVAADAKPHGSAASEPLNVSQAGSYTLTNVRENGAGKTKVKSREIDAKAFDRLSAQLPDRMDRLVDKAERKGCAAQSSGNSAQLAQQGTDNLAR